VHFCARLQLDLLEVSSEFQSTTEIIRTLKEELISTWLVVVRNPDIRTWCYMDEQILTAAKPTAGFIYDQTTLINPKLRAKATHNRYL
jgi:hypothetical protein